MPSAIANLLGKVDANNALVVSLSGGPATATQFFAGDGSAAAPSYTFTNDPDNGLFLAGTNILGVSAAGAAEFGVLSGGIRLRSSAVLTWSSANDITSASDLVLARDGIGVFALKNGTNPQTLRVYGTATGPRYLNINHTGGNAQIFTNDTAAIQFGIATTISWQIVSPGHLLLATTDTYDIGAAAGANRPRNVYAQNFVGGGAGLTGIAGATGGVSNTGNTNIVADSDNDGTGLIDFTTGLTSKWQILNAGHLQAMAAVQFRAADGVAGTPSISFTNDADTGLFLAGSGVFRAVSNAVQTAQFDGSGITIFTGFQLRFGNSTDLVFTREGADHFFQQRGATAQRASWANTYTSSTNYEAFTIDWQTSANTALIGFRSGSAGGSTRVVRYMTVEPAGSNTGLFLEMNRDVTGATGLFRFGYGVVTSGTAGNYGNATPFMVVGDIVNVATSGSFSALQVKPTYNQAASTAANTDLLINRTQTAVGSGQQLLIDAQVSGASQFSVSANGQVNSGSSIRAAYVSPTPAGGNTTTQLRIGSANVAICIGTGVPTLSAAQGSIYLRTDGGANQRIYSNTDGATGWTPMTG